MNMHNNNDNLTPEEQQLQAAVRGLGEVRAEDSFREELRRRFVSGEIAAADKSAEPAPQRPAPAPIIALPARAQPWRRLAWVAVPAIAAALAVVLLGGSEPAWQLQNVRGQGGVVVNGVTVDVSDRAGLAGLIVDHAHLTVPEGVEFDVRLDEVMVVGVVGPAEFTLPASPAEGPFIYEASIQAGEFRLKTGPDFPGRELLLLTTDGRVEITGTTVAVFKNEDLTCVCVLEGTARIGRDRDHLDAVSAGMRKVLFADGREPMILPIEPGHEQSLIEFEGYNRDAFRQ